MMNFSTVSLMNAISDLVNSNAIATGVISDEEFAVVIAAANVNATNHEDFEKFLRLKNL